ncbi:MAG: cyclopropane-fatty-acyl-phospholipid synthase, partial [Candidatus Peregrinibacteria bacterium Greene1014_49]
QGDTSEQYQTQKNERVCCKLGLANVPEEQRRVADLGCGFMSFGRHAAREHNAQVTGITLSPVQHSYATERNQRDGLDDRITPLHGDYRSLEGKFPFVTSIGMVEHVHNRGYREFFRTVKSLLAQGGTALVHTIGSTDKPKVPVNEFTHRYIFPGSRLARLDELTLAARESALQVLNMENLGTHYAETLKHWREKFEAHIPQIQKIDPKVFNDVFIRMWRFYLASSEAGFRHSALQLYQVLLSHDGEWPKQVPKDLDFGRALVGAGDRASEISSS